MEPTLIGVNHKPSTLWPYHQLVVACCTPVCTPGSLATTNSRVIQSRPATMYQTLTYSDSTLRLTSGEQHGADDADEAGRDEYADLPGNLEVFHAVGPAGANGPDAAGNAGVEQRPPEHHPHRTHQWGAQQARQQPHDDAQGSIGDPAVEHRIQVHGADAART